MKLIKKHNQNYDRKLTTFTLKANQFTDMRLTQFNALFPPAVYPTMTFDFPLNTVQNPPATFNPFTDQGLVSEVEDQGILCNSGWAYSAAKSIEILQQYQGTLIPLSAQNLIDCSGRSTACRTQVPQTGFDYLTMYDQVIYSTTDYPNNITISEQNMCIIPPAPITGTKLSAYSVITDGDDATMLRYVGNNYPVVIEFNPTSFEFMHYADGVFQQPRTSTGSHFMVVLGYEEDATSGLNTWLVQNSFGKTWGKGGRISIRRDAVTPLAKHAIFPAELA
ncbi:macrodontain-1-like [Teleopsis dalmanni]|uniref:macrodontain-1-like n=1 Tax=Teleopsis dalmanni TaxID=139649 RepID=UPI0018CC8301|nr:macrodontain-1-like [Teleopsis dalmanni]